MGGRCERERGRKEERGGGVREGVKRGREGEWEGKKVGGSGCEREVGRKEGERG